MFGLKARLVASDAVCQVGFLFYTRSFKRSTHSSGILYNIESSSSHYPSSTCGRFGRFSSVLCYYLKICHPSYMIPYHPEFGSIP